jgi:hypothetical protein
MGGLTLAVVVIGAFFVVGLTIGALLVTFLPYRPRRGADRHMKPGEPTPGRPRRRR